MQLESSGEERRELSVIVALMEETRRPMSQKGREERRLSPSLKFTDCFNQNGSPSGRLRLHTSNLATLAYPKRLRCLVPVLGSGADPGL